MRYFLDTEFIERGRALPLELISLGLVAEDGRELALINRLAHPDRSNTWVHEHVWPAIQADRTTERVMPSDLPERILEFLGDDPAPEFWGYFADYDWVVFCQLFGDMSQLPTGWPFYCRDLKQLIDERGLAISQDDSDHTAIGDARWARETWLVITTGAMA